MSVFRTTLGCSVRCDECHTCAPGVPKSGWADDDEDSAWLSASEHGFVAVGGVGAPLRALCSICDNARIAARTVGAVPREPAPAPEPEPPPTDYEKAVAAVEDFKAADRCHAEWLELRDVTREHAREALAKLYVTDRRRVLEHVEVDQVLEQELNEGAHGPH